VRDSPGPASLFLERWQQGPAPDLRQFLAAHGELTPAHLAAVLGIDLRERWQRHDCIPAEDYLRDFPTVQADREAALDVVYCEYLARCNLGESPATADFARRFPDLEAELTRLIEVHRALQTGTASALSAPDSSTVQAPLPAASPAGNGDPPPESFGRYRLLGMLGRGGMGEVFLAHDTQLGRDVALKVMRLGSDDNLRVQRFYREARVAAALNHPGLCPIYDVGEFGGYYYLTMPRVRGETLAQQLRRDGPLPPPGAAQLAAQVARAVHVAHQASIVHRDLKPSNVMIDATGQPIVMDFGLARRRASDDPRLTALGSLVGTPAYLAPEYIGGEPAVASPAGDVYSLGVMLYEMLTGGLPFQGTTQEVLQQALTVEPEPPSRRCPGLDARLEAVCLTALAKAPAARYASMEAFAAALDDSLVAGDRPARVRSSARKKAALVVGAATLGLVLLSVVLGLSLLGRGANAAADLFQAGSQWEGEFRFDAEHAGTMRVSVQEREGDAFRGLYVCEPGNYGWHITGSVDGGQVQWGFTAPVARSKGFQALVGRAEVRAVLNEEVLAGRFEDRGDGTKAAFSLRLKK
jgi:hypothetical protein